MQSMLAPGDSFGKYRLRQEIGQGGTGVVYLAHDTGTDSPVALKVLAPELTASAEYRERLATEARLCASIDSPYVVRVLDAGEIDGSAFVAMEHVAGADLRTGAADWDFRRKIELVTQIGRGLHTAHQQGLVHRDLKPENIKLTEDGIPKVLDFGLAREIDTESVDEYGNVEGTLYYLSPEQLSGQPITAASDVFSFGVICYELFAGCRPFEGEYSASVIYSILHEDPPQPSEINSELPPWMDALVMKLMAKRPPDRFQSIREAIAFLQANKDIVARPGEKWVKKRQTATVVDLKNLSGDPNWEYFCEGFTEDVIRELSRRTGLVVSGQPSTSYQRNIRETFEKCHSDFVVVGSLLKWQDQIKLNLSVYGHNGDELVWDATFSDSADNLFALLGRAAQEASARLSAAANSPVVQVEEELQPDVSAYDYYLKGRNYYQTNKPDDLEFALRMYARALEIDPKFAQAHAGLSDVYAFKFMAYYDHTHECIEQARRHALSALEIDPWLPEGFRSLGRYYMFIGEETRAEEAFMRAVEFNPKYAVGFRTLGWLKIQQGDYKTAYEFARRALEMAPTDLETHLLLGLIHINEQKYTLAVSALQRAIELGPDYGRAYYQLGQAYLKLGVLEPALDNLKLACRYKGDPNCYVDAGYVHILQGDLERAKTAFHESINHGCFPFVANYYLGLVGLMTEQPDRGQAAFQKAVDELSRTDFTQGENLEMLAFLALAYAGSGQIGMARRTLVNIERFPITNGELQYNLARCWMLLGESELAAGLLDRAKQSYRGPSEKEIELDPHFSGLKL